MSNVKKQHGLILNSLSGFYTVWSEGQEYITKPRGNFRHQKIKPLAGDNVVFELVEQADENEANGRLVEVEPRRNALVRPPVANVTHAFVVMSLVEPDFSYNLLDYYLVSLEHENITPIILLSKQDVALEQLGDKGVATLIHNIRQVYEPIGYQIIVLDYRAKIEDLVVLEPNSLYIVMGQSGAGKSTFLNRLLPNITLETAAISQSLNRGKHTTREVTLYPFHDAFIADTPGFSALDFATIEKESLMQCFPEIAAKQADCRFRTCQHINEPNCAVLEAVASGDISEQRYRNYFAIYDKIANRKPVYNKRK